MHRTPSRLAQMTATRDRLNRAGDYSRIVTDWDEQIAYDTLPRNGSTWNKKRIRVRNKLNALLRMAERAAEYVPASPERIAEAAHVRRAIVALPPHECRDCGRDIERCPCP